MSALNHIILHFMKNETIYKVMLMFSCHTVLNAKLCGKSNIMNANDLLNKLEDKEISVMDNQYIAQAMCEGPIQSACIKTDAHDAPVDQSIISDLAQIIAPDETPHILFGGAEADVQSPDQRSDTDLNLPLKIPGMS